MANVETLLNTEDRPEVEKITALIKNMNATEQNNMLIFLQGVKFAENLSVPVVAKQN